MSNSHLLIITLPSLIHRIGGEPCQHAKSLAHSMHCQLKRIRRSRHWQITGIPEDLHAFQEVLQQEPNPKFHYLITKLQQGLAQASPEPDSKAKQLATLIEQQPDITLSELMEKTKCTLSEARIIRGQVEASQF
ncbi:ribosome recycling factor family protein [Vibrio aphrogenes]|uniref:ribosome recycling factor family protein n=1 Tax=Vibrio aphrogenes TaxID=1891186 RepID=UPI000B356311|nr:ribosome recycling factor family protein [Vibrio aphrogenes]